MTIELTALEAEKLATCVQYVIHEFDTNLMEHNIWLEGYNPKTKRDWANYDRDADLQAIEYLKGLKKKLEVTK
jgi:hypothetical protein